MQAVAQPSQPNGRSFANLWTGADHPTLSWLFMAVLLGVSTVAALMVVHRLGTRVAVTKKRVAVKATLRARPAASTAVKLGQQRRRLSLHQLAMMGQNQRLRNKLRSLTK